MVNPAQDKMVRITDRSLSLIRLSMKGRNDNSSPGNMTREIYLLAFTRGVGVDTHYFGTLAEEIRKLGKSVKSLKLLGEKLLL